MENNYPKNPEEVIIYYGENKYDGFRLVKNCCVGLLAIKKVLEKEKAFYIDVRNLVLDDYGNIIVENKCLVAGWLPKFNPLWGSGRFNAKKLENLASKKIIKIPSAIDLILWGMVEDANSISSPEELQETIIAIGVTDTVKALKETAVMLP